MRIAHYLRRFRGPLKFSHNTTFYAVDKFYFHAKTRYTLKQLRSRRAAHWRIVRERPNASWF